MAKSPIIQVSLSLALDSAKIDISDMITTLSYKRSVKHDDQLILSIDDADDIDWLMEQPACIAGGTVTFSYGYIGENLSHPRKMFIGDIENGYRGNGGMTIVSADVSKKLKKMRSNKIWLSFTPLDVAQAYAELHGLTVVLQTEYRDASGDLRGSISPITGLDNTVDIPRSQIDTIISQGTKPVTYGETIKSEPQAYMSDWDFLQMKIRALKNGAICYTEGDKLVICIKAYDANSSQTIIAGQYDDLISMSFRYKENNAKGSEHTTGSNNFDLTTTERTILLGDYHFVGANGVKWVKVGKGEIRLATQADVKAALDQVAYSSIYKEITQLPAMLATIPIAEIDKYICGGFTMYPVSQLINEIAAITEYAMEAEAEKLLTMTIVESGNVDRLTNTVITVGGVATRYQGNWYIESITDTVTEQGFKTSFDSIKTAGKNGLIPTKAANKTVGEDKLVAGKKVIKLVPNPEPLIDRVIDFLADPTQQWNPNYITPEQASKVIITTRDPIDYNASTDL